MRRPFDWAVDCGRQFPPIVGYGRGRRLFDEPTERQLKAEDQLRHRRTVERIDYTPAEGFAVAALTCGHSVRLPGRPRSMAKTLDSRVICPECAA